MVEPAAPATELASGLRWAAFASRVGAALSDTSTEVYFADAVTLQFLGANEAACNNLGYTPGEMLSLSVGDIAIGFDRTTLEQRLADLRSGEIGELLRDSEHLRKDGTVYPVELNLLISRDESGDLLIGLAHDITNRRHNEGELALSRERLDLAIQGAGVTIWNSDLVNRITYFDDRLERMLGMAIAEPATDIERGTWIHPEDVGRTTEAWVAHLVGKSEAYEAEFRTRAATGEWVWLRAVGRVMEWDAEGRPLRAAGTFVDITEERHASATLATFEAELRALFENSVDLIMMLAPDGEILRVNRGFLRTVGPAGPYETGRNFFDYVPAENTEWRDAGRRCFDAALAGKARTVEFAGDITSAGAWFEMSFSRVDSIDPAQARVAVFIRDITERKLSETAVLREQRVLTEVASAAAAAITPYELMRALRAPMAEMIPRPWIDFGYVSENDVVYPRMSLDPITTPRDSGVDEAIAAGQSHWYGYGEGNLSPGASLLRAAGVHAASLTASSIGGQPFAVFLAASRDPGYVFTEHDLGLLKVIAGIVGPPMANLRASESVRQQRALYDAALSSLSEAVILLDESGEPVFANQPGKEIVDALTVLPAGLVAETSELTVPNQVVMDYVAAVGSRETRSGKRVRVAVEGEDRWYDYEFVPLEFNPPRTLVIAKNVSAEVEKERAEERHRAEMARASRLSALGGLIGGVAHELNNPLTAILGFAEVIEADGGAFTEEVAIIKQEALRARDIVRDLLFIVRPGPVEFGEVVLADAMKHVERLRRSTWQQRGIHTVILIDGDGPRILGNAHHIIQVLLNLTSNAEDALLGIVEPRLEITARTMGNEAVLTVSDNGSGMDALTVERISEPFFTTKAGKGTGLGMSVINNIITIHGGRMEFKSAPGAGTRVEVTLPLWSESEVAGPPTDSASSDPQRAHSVLVIDDEPTLRKLAKRLLESLGHQCEVASSVSEALAATAVTEFDLVICDYRLGGETATQFVDRLPETSRAKVLRRLVIATGATTDLGVSQLLETHNLKLLPKPYGLEQLSSILSDAVLE